MERKFMWDTIPVWEWNGISLIRIGKSEFITAKPVSTGFRNFSTAKEVARYFSVKNNCEANIAYESEWIKLMDYLKINFVTRVFLKENNLNHDEVLLLDSIYEGENYLFAAGISHRLDEIFTGFISGEDSDGEPQARKVLFLTIKF